MKHAENTGSPGQRLLLAGEASSLIATVLLVLGPVALALQVSAFAGLSVAFALAIAFALRERTGRGNERVARASAERAAAEAMARLRASEAFNRGMVETSPDCIKVLSLDGQLEYFSAGGLRVMEIDDFDSCGLRGADWCSLWDQGDRPLVRAAIDAALAGGMGRFQAACATAKGTPKWWDVTVNLMPGIDGEPDKLLSISRDVTEQKQAEIALAQAKELAERAAVDLDARLRELDAARAEAEAASRAKSGFISHLSHEIRTPLNGVLGAASLLRGTSLDEHQRELVGMQQEAGEALLTVINDILDLSKIESGKVELESAPLDLPVLVRRTLDMVRPMARDKGLTLHHSVACGSNAGAILGDAVRLRQVLLNLVNNAVKFTARGCVAVEVTVVDETTEHRRLRMTVTDTGIGIPSEALGRLFMPFEQADSSTTRRFGGTGLGLSICRELVTLMGGEIGVRSEVGCGSMFWVELPLRHAAAEGSGDDTVRQPHASAAEVPRGGEAVGVEPSRGPDGAANGASGAADDAPGAGRPLRVLLAEDVRINQVIATKVLENAGHVVTVVENGVGAIDAVANDDFDVVLMDVRMPEVDGIEATQRIRAMAAPKAGIPVIGLTAEAMREDLDRCIAAGMDDAMTKPFDRADLLARIRRLAERRAA